MSKTPRRIVSDHLRKQWTTEADQHRAEVAEFDREQLERFAVSKAVAAHRMSERLSTITELVARAAGLGRHHEMGDQAALDILLGWATVGEEAARSIPPVPDRYWVVDTAGTSVEGLAVGDGKQTTWTVLPSDLRTALIDLLREEAPVGDETLAAVADRVLTLIHGSGPR